MVGDRDCASSPLGLSHAPVLVERGRAGDTGLVYTLRPVDIVRAAVRHDRSESSCARAGVVRPEVFDDVILDQGTRSPTVDREVRIAIW